MATRNATAIWEGDLFEGSGTVSAESSGLFRDAGVTWAARTEDPDGKTSPEELIAAAHAACFCMALSNELSTRGQAPEKLRVSAGCSFEDGTVTAITLDVASQAPGVDDPVFKEALAAAEGSCPVSNALRGNVAIEVRTNAG
jgi:osmotically inducible protein OsmC